MANPIVFDCGGCTRIKQILPSLPGKLSTIMDVDVITPITGTGPLPAGSTGSQQIVPPGASPFSNFSILFQDAAGVPFTITFAALPNSFLIQSDGDQNVRGDFASGNLIITVYSSKDDPLIAEKQQRRTTKRQFRYEVENAGGIKTIILNDTTIATTAFDASTPGAVPTAPGAVTASGALPVAGLPLYVSVIVS